MMRWYRLRGVQELGTGLRVVGGALCAVGYVVPWLTYHYEGGNLDVTTNYWQAIFGPYNLDGAPNSPVLNAAIVLLFPFPLIIAMVALGTSARPPSWIPPRLSVFVSRVYWPVTILATIELLLMIYLLDPFGRFPGTGWVYLRDPAPTVEPGFLMTFSGLFAIILGGLLRLE